MTGNGFVTPPEIAAHPMPAVVRRGMRRRRLWKWVLGGAFLLLAVFAYLVLPLAFSAKATDAEVERALAVARKLRMATTREEVMRALGASNVAFEEKEGVLLVDGTTWLVWFRDEREIAFGFTEQYGLSGVYVQWIRGIDEPRAESVPLLPQLRKR